MGSLKRWWLEKYKLPTNHDLFQNQSQSELMIEWYEDLYQEKSTLLAQLEYNSGSGSEHVEKRLTTICEILGEEATFGDPLVAYWDEQAARGEVPDLDMTLDDLRRLKENGR